MHMYSNPRILPEDFTEYALFNSVYKDDVQPSELAFELGWTITRSDYEKGAEPSLFFKTDLPTAYSNYGSDVGAVYVGSYQKNIYVYWISPDDGEFGFDQYCTFEPKEFGGYLSELKFALIDFLTEYVQNNKTVNVYALRSNISFFAQMWLDDKRGQ